MFALADQQAAGNQRPEMTGLTAALSLPMADA
jgi:hypothetical protein